MTSKKKSSGRLSSLFSLGDSNGSSQKLSLVPSPSRLSPNIPPVSSPSSPVGRSSHSREPSAQLLPPPAHPLGLANATISRKPIAHASTENLTIPQSPAHMRPGHKSQTASPATSRPPSIMGSAIGSRPTTPIPQIIAPSPGQLTPESTTTKVKRKSWLHKEKDAKNAEPKSWILGSLAPYDVSALVNAQQIPELWDESGNTFVYLFPRISGKGPSFRIHSSTFAASNVLRDLARSQSMTAALREESGLENHARKLSVTDPSAPSTPPMTPELRARRDDDSSGSYSPTSTRVTSNSFGSDSDSPIHLYLPITLSTDGAAPSPGGMEPKYSQSDIDHLVTVRNTFAFLAGGSLVATERRPNVFSIFMQISEILKYFGFSNLDGSTFGEIASLSFDKYVEELQIADVRQSREKTVEAIVLGERMRAVMLYNEGFVHGVGKYEEITKLKSTKFQLISPVTQNRMERAALDLSIRQQNIEIRLQEFDFPAIFSGIMNSKTDDARKLVNFDSWKNSFNSTRKFLISHYKHKYGSWPPKASSKKNSLETSGLNRIVIRDLYHDLSSVYDLLVNRKSLTTRGLDGVHEDAIAQSEPFSMVLRRVLHEYDSSTPPVQPAVPYDVPIFPDLSMTRKDYGFDAAKDLKARAKKVKEDELKSLLRSSVNQDSNISTPFLDAFKDFEYKSLRGKTVTEICDIRCGEWIFLYAVLQALPMLVIDAPGVKWTSGVEYFLCEPPRSGVPWAREDRGLQRNWYGVAGGGVVSLPSDVIEHGIEGVYRRSHCWEMAAKWSGESAVLSAAVTESLGDPLPPPPGIFGAGPGSRPGSTHSNRSSVVNIGLEALPIPNGVAPSSPVPKSATTPTVDASKTFDAILGTAPTRPTKKR